MKPRPALDYSSKIGTPCAVVRAVCTTVVGLALISPAASLGAAAAIYRCLDKKQAVLYTDEPCKDGQVIDVRAGDADPAALARLDRERDALSQSATQRIADERRNAAQRDLAATYARPAENNIDNYRPTDVSYSDGVGYWYPPFVPDRPRPRPPRPVGPPRFGPQPQPIVFPR